MFLRFLLVIIIISISTAFLSGHSNSNLLVMTITGINTQKGDILIAVFPSESGFPYDPKKAIRLLKSKPANGKAVATVNDLPAGRYAVSVFHDTNNNEKFDTNFLGIPQEGYGVSNNALNRFSAPEFGPSSFAYSGNLSIEIKIKY
jgi:uncharacterized protein (DUF2141 family)